MTLSLTTLAVTLAEADAYATARLQSGWLTRTSADRTAALRRGQDYIAGQYNSQWANVWDNSAAPEEVKFAITEAAYREIATPGILSPDITLGEKKILTGVKGITWEPMYRGGGVSSFRPVVTVIEGLLSGVTTGLGATAFLDRA